MKTNVSTKTAVGKLPYEHFTSYIRFIYTHVGSYNIYIAIRPAECVLATQVSKLVWSGGSHMVGCVCINTYGTMYEKIKNVY